MWEIIPSSVAVIVGHISLPPQDTLVQEIFSWLHAGQWTSTNCLRWT